MMSETEKLKRIETTTPGNTLNVLNILFLFSFSLRMNGGLAWRQ